MGNSMLIFGFSFFFISSFLKFLNLNIILFFGIIFFILTFIFKFIFKNNVFFIIFISGFLAFCVFIVNFWIKERYFLDFNNKELTIEAVILDTPYENNGSFYYLLKIYNIKNVKKIPKFNAGINSAFILDAKVGDQIETKINFFSYKNLYDKIKNQSKGIYVNGYFSDYANIKLINKNNNINLLNFIPKMRFNIFKKIDEMFSKDTVSLIDAMWLGDRRRVSTKLRDGFLNLGISHLLAISGVHVGILLNFFYNILKFLKLKRKILDFFCILIIICFILITGCLPSVLRAGIMAIIYLIGKILNRHANSLISLSTSLFLISFFNPNSCIDLGLWLSSFSVIGIILFSDKIQIFFKKILNLNDKNNLFLDYIILNLSTSIASNICILPIIIIFLKNISMVFIISNILIMLPITFFLCLIIISIIFNFFLNFDFLIKLSEFLSKIIIITITYFSKFSFLILGLDYSFIKLWVLFTLLLISLCFYLNKLNNIIKIELYSILILFSGIISYNFYTKDKIKASFIANESGDFIIFTKNKESIILVFNDIKLNTIKKYFQNSFITTTKCILNFSNTINDTKDFIEFISFFKIKYLINKNNFKENKCFDFFDNNLKIQTFNINGKIWIRIFMGNLTLLIASQGGNASYLPSELKECDIFIANNLPNNFREINFKSIILNNKFIENNIKKFLINTKIIPLNGSIYIDCDILNKKYFIKSNK